MTEETNFLDKIYLHSLKNFQPVINHIHWDGSIPAKALFEFYQEKGQELFLPEKDIAGNKIRYESKEDQKIKSPEELQQFQQGLLKKYDIVDVFAIPVGAMRTIEDLQKMALAHSEYLASQGIKYSETRFAPIYHVNSEGGLNSMEEVIRVSINGFNQAKKKTGVTIKPIVCINRETDLNTAKKIVKAALEFEGEIVGIDLACYEPIGAAEKFKPAFDLTLNSSLKRTIHAGEMMGNENNNSKNIRYALKNLHLDGISHAISLYKNQDLVSYMAAEGIRLESNPRSNLRCGFIKDTLDLHLNELVDKGVLVTVSSDDPAMWPNGDLEHNLYLVGKTHGHNLVKRVARNSILSAWGLETKEKVRMLKKIQ